MRIECPNCHKAYEIPDERLPYGKRIKFPCPSCKRYVKLALPSHRGVSQRDPASVSATGSGEGTPDLGALKREILDSVGDLPPMSEAMHKARKVLADPNSSFKDLAIVFVTDQAIAARVLKLANSAYYGLSNQVSSIQHAAVVLGYRTLGELVTVASTSELMSKALNGYGLESGALWQHSLAVAFGSKFIAGKKNPALVNDAFAAGLIHDAGKLILDEYIVERRQAFQACVSEGQRGLVIAEKDVLGIDHAEIASEICKRWNVPQKMTTGIRYHHDPARSEGSELANILHVADGLAMMCGLGGGTDILAPGMDESAISVLGLESDDLEKVMNQVVASVNKTMEEFHD
ncbi:MAG: HDOD domain-containing protein [Thermodesulfobacteriota bacterium]|nr:HDOD domain-containing protein [Thermodesulfobacteriota bacterium]